MAIKIQGQTVIDNDQNINITGIITAAQFNLPSGLPISETIVSETSPSTAELGAGALWWNSDSTDGSLYILYQDPTGPNGDPGGKYWVEAAPAPDSIGFSGSHTGDSTFTGDMTVTGTVDAGLVNVDRVNVVNTTETGSDIVHTINSGSSLITTQRSKADGSLQIGSIDGNSDTANIELNADGSASFADTRINLNLDGSIDTYRSSGDANSDLQAWQSDIGGTKFVKARIKADGSATFAANVEARNFEGRRPGTNLDVFAGYAGTTLTSQINANGSASFAAGALAIASTGNLSVNRTAGTNDVFNGRLNGSTTTTINADGSAEFAGNVFGNRIFARSDTDVDTLVVGKKTGTSIEQGAAIIKNDGSAEFGGSKFKISAVGELEMGPWASGTSSKIVPGAISVRSDDTSTGAYVWRSFKDGATNSDITSLITPDGSAYFASNVGIGTTSPLDALHVSTGNNNDSGEKTIAIGGTINNARSASITKDTSTPYDLKIVSSRDNSFGTAITFETNTGNERMRIDSSGELRHTPGGGTSSTYIKGNVENTTDYVFKAFRDGAFSTALAFQTQVSGAGSERMRIDTSGNVGIGQSSPAQLLHLTSTGSNAFVQFSDSGSGGSAAQARIGSNGNDLVVLNNTSSNAATERVRITSAGRVSIPNTGGYPSVSGHTFEPYGLAMHATQNDTCLLLNRQAADGTLVQFRHASATEGTISVSGGTVSYNGGHLSRWSQLPGGAERTEILRGSVLSNIDEMCEWSYEAKPAVLWEEGDGMPEGVSAGDIRIAAQEAGTENNEQLNRMKVSDVEGDKNVSGVFQSWDDDDDTYTNDFYCAMTGDFVIRIAQGTTVARGDLLMSAGDGTAKPQDDDIVRSKTIAKVTSTTVSATYSDGSYCVPCVLMAC